MIVKCDDGFYYKNPIWENDRVAVCCDMDTEIFIKYHRAMAPRAVLKALGSLGLFAVLVPADGTLKGPCPGEMVNHIFGGKLKTAFRVVVKFKTPRKRPLPVPTSHLGRFEIAPSKIEDEIIE